VAIAVGTSFLGIADKFDLWLSFCGSLCGPLAGIMIAHFLILQGKREKFYVPKVIRLSGWISWLAAGIGSQFTHFTSIPTLEAIVMGFVLYIILYLILDKTFNLHKDKDADTQVGQVWDMPNSETVSSNIMAEKTTAAI
jgi:cytosine permease